MNLLSPILTTKLACLPDTELLLVQVGVQVDEFTWNRKGIVGEAGSERKRAENYDG